MTRMAVFNCVSILLVCELFIQTALQYSTVEKTIAKAEIRKVLALAPQFNYFLFLFLDLFVLSGTYR